MLRRLYVNNYRCLVNFGFTPQKQQLLLGRNGAGKTSVFDVLARVRAFIVDGTPAPFLFLPSSITNWQQLRTQRFELNVAGPDGEFHYVLELEHDSSGFKSRVAREELFLDRKPLFAFVGGDVQLYKDDHKIGPKFTLDWTRSGLFNVAPGPSNHKLTWFKEWVGRILFLQLNPFAMGSRAEREDTNLYTRAENFANWYRHQAQENQGQLTELFRHLREAVDGFDSFSLINVGENIRILKAQFKTKASEALQMGWATSLGFEELSEGQKCLSVLFSILVFAAKKGALLCLDEPDNFVALRELQPLIAELSVRAGKENCQLLISSHHPTLIDYFASDGCLLLSRPALGPTVVEELAVDLTSALTASEQVARGWENG